MRPKPLNKGAQPCWEQGYNAQPATFQGIRCHPPSTEVRGTGFHVKCHLCRTTLVFEDKPTRSQEGWQRARCSGCKKQVRMGKAQCLACLRPLNACLCSALPGTNLTQTRLPWTARKGDTRSNGSSQHTTPPAATACIASQSESRVHACRAPSRGVANEAAMPLNTSTADRALNQTRTDSTTTGHSMLNVISERRVTRGCIDVDAGGGASGSVGSGDGAPRPVM